MLQIIFPFFRHILAGLRLSILFVCITLASGFAQSDLDPDAATFAHLKKFRTSYIESLLNKKPELMQNYYADNIRLMPVFQRTVIGKENALKYYQSLLLHFEVTSYARTETEILNLGKRIIEHGIFVMNVKLKSTGKQYEIKGKYQNIWEKPENGKLALITEGWNFDHPLEIENEFKFEKVPVVDIALAPHLAVNDHISFELAALNRLMEVTITQHDAKIWAQFYSDDALLFSQCHPAYAGRKALNEYFEMHAKELPVFETLAIRNDRIDDLGNFVIEYASHVAAWRAGEYSGTGLGKDLRIWRREKNGSLKIFRHIGMYD